MIFSKPITEKLNIRIIVLFFILMIFSDFLVKFSNITKLVELYRYSGAVKLAFEAYLLLIIIQNGIDRYFIRLILLLVSCFFIGQFFLQVNSVFNSNILIEILRGDIYYMNKYVFIILFVSVVSQIKNKIELTNKILDLLVIILWLNSITILLGLFFEINLFKSFPSTNRFGYSGMFSKSGESILLYVLAIILFYLNYLKGKKSLFPIVFFGIISILSGKKIAFILPILLFIVHFCMWHKYKILYRSIGLFSVLLLILLKDKIIEFLLNYFPFWQTLFDKKGIWTVIFSTRNLNLKSTLSFISENWSMINYFFGGQDYNKLKIEIAPLDSFVFFGIIGGLSYLYFIKKTYLNHLNHNITRWLFLGYIVIGMIYGGFLINPILMSVLYVFSIFCCFYEKSINKDLY